jgi:hypothetical protein
MVLASRLLVAGGASGAIPGPARTLRTLTSSPQGGWTQIQDPKAIHSTGDIEVGKYVHATGVTTTHVLAAAFEPGVFDPGIDIHSSPAVIVRSSDHKLVVAASHHAETSTPHIWISPNAEDITGSWTAVTPGASIGAAQYTYMVLYQMASGTIYLFYRDYISGTNTGRLGFSSSTDGGSTWASRKILYTGAAGKVPYWRIVGDGAHRIDVFATDDVPTASPLGHFYYDTTADLVYQTDGTNLAAWDGHTNPLVFSDLTLVHAATCWSWGASIDALGRPATVLMEDIGSDNAIKVARWRSGAWHTDTVIASVGGQLTGNQYASGAAIHHTNPDIVYAAKKATHWEMWRYVSTDDGATWTGTQLTSGSSVDNVWAEVVHNPGPGLEGVWLAGTYFSDAGTGPGTGFAFGITGFG